MKNLKNITKLFCLLTITLFISCNSDKEDNGLENPDKEYQNGGSSDFYQNWGATTTANFFGRIVDENNSALEGVFVEIGNKSAMTDGSGVYQINDADVYEEFAYIKASKGGFINGSRALIPTDGINSSRIMLLQENTIATIASGSQETVSLANGTKIVFSGDFKDENNNPYTGTVAVILKHLDPSDEFINDKMPGMLYAENAEGEERVLETYGMIAVELKGASGEKLQLADNTTAEIQVPVDPAQLSNAPSTIPLWHFDEALGFWVEQGTATLVDGKYIGEVSHFSFWNCDAQFATVDLCISLEDNLGTAIGNTTIELWRSGATYPRNGTTDLNGDVCGLIPSNEILTMNILDTCGNIVSTTTIGPFTSNSSIIEVVNPGTAQLVNIIGNLENCSGTNVTNGYVTYNTGGFSTFMPLSSGAFSSAILMCNATTPITVQGYDYDTLQTSGPIQMNMTAPNTNFGTIIACTAVTEFITYSINGGAAVTYISDIHVNENTANGSFTINSQKLADTFFIYSSVNTTGVYPTYDQIVDGMLLELSFIDYTLPANITFDLVAYGAVGQYIDITFSGSYTNSSGVSETIVGTIHVLRDS